MKKNKDEKNFMDDEQAGLEESGKRAFFFSKEERTIYANSLDEARRLLAKETGQAESTE